MKKRQKIKKQECEVVNSFILLYYNYGSNKDVRMGHGA